MNRGPGTLLERDAEIDVLTSALSRAVAGHGGLVLVYGPAGIGKTRLLETCAQEACTPPARRLAVRGDELVMDAAFAAVRELFWRDVAARPEIALAGAARLAAPVFENATDEGFDSDRVGAVLHGLHWLVANLADQQPIALLIDDAHWLDPPSARFLVYLARRLDSLPVFVAVAFRSGGEADEGLFPMLADSAAEVLRPGPLSETATSVLIRGELGVRADDELCRSCHEATGGNPFYLRELTAALAADGRRPTVELARSVRALGAGSVARSVLIRIARLGHDCRSLAHAVSVLAPGCALRQAAALAELDSDRARVAADALRSADLIAQTQELSFAHPIVREAVTAEMATSRRAHLHGAAARLLADEGASTDQIAAHLLSADPFGEGWVVDVLRHAAEQAVARGAPEVAVAYLRRALAEPPDQDARVDVLVELGRTEAQLPVAHDFSALREALELAPTPERRAAVAEELISALLGAPDNPAARAIAERVLASGDLDPARLTRLEGHLIGAGAPDLAAVDRILARARPLFERVMSDEAADPVMLGALAMAGAVAGYQASDVARLAERAVRDDRLLKWHRALNGASGALAWTDRLDAAAAAQDVGLAVAQQRGNLPMFTGLSVFRADTAFRAGELALAEAHGRRAFELGHELGLDAFALMWLLGIVMERDGPREAAALLEPLDLSEPLLGVWHGVVCLAQRGRIRFGLGDFQRGLDDLLAADRRMSEHHLHLSVLIDWVPIATTALAQLGRIDEARELAARELADAAAFGAARRHGIALSVTGRLEAGDRGLGLLREAVDLLESSPARLEHARALMNLGIGLRERGERKIARTPLAAALDIAHRCGGNLLAEQAREALVAAGARPRRNVLTGPEALTPAEARIARLAADGQTNREIAQALFLSVKTVEWQLSHAYAKLRVARRGELADALHPPLARSHDDRGARIETPG